MSICFEIETLLGNDLETRKNVVRSIARKVFGQTLSFLEIVLYE